MHVERKKGSIDFVCKRNYDTRFRKKNTVVKMEREDRVGDMRATPRIVLKRRERE